MVSATEVVSVGDGTKVEFAEDYIVDYNFVSFVQFWLSYLF